MIFDNTKYSHLTNDDLVRTILSRREHVNALEYTLAVRMNALLNEMDSLTESANLLSLALREYGVYADIEPTMARMN